VYGSEVRRRSIAVLILSLALGARSSSAASSKPAPPRSEDLPALAASLAEALQGKTVTLPSGESIAVVASEGDALLSPKRIEQSLATIGEADAWPSAWLVVQDSGRDFDLVMHVRLEASGGVEAPDVVFAAPRREWDDAALESAVKAAGGKAPKERRRNLVIQSFSKRVETTYVYEVPKQAKGDKGLAPLLPEGSLIREARSVELGDGRRHTIAIVQLRPTFLPSDCRSCEDRFHGHADAGPVSIVLAGETALEDTLDVTEALRGSGKKALVPRYACTEDDAQVLRAGGTERFGGREPIRLLELADYDGDGQALEVALDGEFLECNRHGSVVVAIDAKESKLRLLVPRSGAR
jgi:hypothetical protein